MTGGDELVEVQATGEGVSFPRESLDQLLELAASGIRALRRAQDAAAGPLPA
jgi:ribonuclease PH